MSTYSPSLRIELITTGDQAGVWGNTTNSNLGTLIESAIAGYTSVSVTSANQALTALNGAADESRNQSIALTTTTTANFAVYAPPAEKTYVIYNASAYAATLYNSTVLGNTTAAGAGVAIPAGKTITAWSDGTNFYFQNNHLSSLTLVTDLAVADGGTGASTAGDARTNLDVPSRAGSGASGTWAIDVSGNAATATSATNATNATNLTGGAMACSSGSITSAAPTLSFVDTDGADFSVHVNSNLWYVLNQSGSGLIYTDQSGNFTAVANVTAYSDERLKTDWAALPVDFVERLAKVKHGTYTRIDSGERQAGSSAQDWQKLLPEVVGIAKDEQGTLSLAYGNAALVACVALANEVVELKKKLGL